MRPRLTVVGIGGAGCNAINNMIASGLNGVDFVVANTDAQALASSSAERRIQLGANLTEGLGAGSKPEVGEAAAEEAVDEIRSHIAGSHMLFIAAGMGGGTGTGAATVVARVARELGILTVAIVTRPFQFEGLRRQRIADIGIAELKPYVDTLIVIPNQNLFRVANERTTFAEAFVMADQVLYSGVACIVDLIIKEGLINLDFADVRTVLSGMGTAMMGTGEAEGPRRAIEAAEEAISNPLLDDVSLRGARGLLLSISGGRDLTLYEVDEAASRVRAEVDPEANIIVGATFDESLGDRVRVSIVASGMLRQNELSRDSSQPAHAGSSMPLPGFAGFVTTGQMPPLAQTPSTPQSPMMPPLSSSQESGLGGRDVPREMPSLDRTSAGMAMSDARIEQTARPAPPPAPPFMPPQHDEMQHRLSQALQHDDDALTDHADRIDRHDHQERADLWHGPGSVTIEEAPPLPPQALPQTPPGNLRRVEIDELGFTPELPTEIRRGSRRVPEIEEFPQVAQREYRSRMDGGREPAPARKPGLFERLIGSSRRADDSPDEQPSSRDSAREGGHTRYENGHDGRQYAGHRAGRNPEGGSAADRQPADMPAIYRKDRR